MDFEQDLVPPSSLCLSLQHRDSIRLLTLHPGIPTDSIVLSLDEFIMKSEDSAYDFEALSYTWDNQIPSHIVVCNGFKTLVTKNIQDALIALRQSDQVRKLWIDQMCINQSDLEERSQQVTIMSDVYTKAKRVIIWLGNADEHTKRVFELLKIFAKIHQQGYLPAQLGHVATGGIPEPINSDPASFENGRFGYFPDVQDLPVLPTADSQDLIHVQSLLSRSWFTRMWTYQETVLCSELSMIHQGAFVIQLSEFLLAMSTIDYCGYFKDIAWNAACRAHSYCKSVASQRLIHNDTRTLNAQLYVTNGLSSQDPRDRVYALRGLCSNKYKSLLVPDYSLPLEQVYGTAVKACINLSRSLEVLGHLQWFDDRPTDLPSWVPDWREERSSFGLAYSMRDTHGRQYYQASKGRDLQLIHCDDPTHLALGGIRLGQIKRALRHRLAPTEHELTWRECPRWRPEVWYRMYKEEIERMNIPKSCAKDQETSRVYAGSDNLFFSDDLLETTVRRTLTGDMYPVQTPGRLEPGYQIVFFKSYVAWRSCGFQGQGIVPKQVIIEHDRYVYDAMRSRDLFVIDTEAGDTYLCATTVSAQPGDWVCVLSGGDAPFVLRQRNFDSSVAGCEAQNTWELIGDCYVHGIMDGEFVEGKHPDSDEVFILD